ncbi:MAG: YceI family protein [Pseudomonadota bacterium]
MRWLWLVFLGFLVLPVQARDWQVDYAKSAVRFVIRQMNVPVEGGFRRFAAQADFDPARPEQGRLRVELDVGSIDTGSTEGDGEARRPLWFDAARHPRAVFVSKAIRRLADGRYAASGELNVKGQVRPVTVPFALVRQANGGWLAEGGFALRRSDFGIGGGDWNDVVDDVAEARFRIALLP